MRRSRHPDRRRHPGRPGKEVPDGASLLLRAAQSVFAREGFQKATLRQIARRAGVDHALVAHRFGSKEALWAAVIEQQAAYLAPFIAELTELQQRVDIPIRGRIETAFRQMVAATLGNPECGMFLSRISSERGDKLDLLVTQLFRPYHDALQPLLVQATTAGIIRQQSPEMLYFMLVMAVAMSVSHRHILGYFEGGSQDIERLRVDMIQFLTVNFLANGARGVSTRSADRRSSLPMQRKQGRKS